MPLKKNYYPTPHLFFCIGILFVLSLHPLHNTLWARWATKDDISSIRSNDHFEINVKKNGTYSLRHSFQEKILKDSARQDSSLFQTSYNSMVSKFKINYAHTINAKKKYAVTKEFIQDKPLASSQNGFDQINQVMVAFPKVEIGSTIAMEYEWNVFQVPFAGHYSQSIVFGDRDMNEKKSLFVKSEIPLYYEVNDPEKYLKIQSYEKDGSFFLRVELLRPIIKMAADEPNISIDPKNFPWVDISTHKSWQDIVAPIQPAYADVLSKPLPPAFQKIANQSREEKDILSKVNLVTSLLANEMRYLGDWRPINGGHIPRSLEKIAQTNFGDCKDFSVVVTAILRNLGINANIAFIRRGINPAFSPNSIPSIHAFNHAIVWFKANGTEYWIDPTNPVSFAQGITEDLIDREALILDSKTPFLTRTPRGVPEESKWKMKSTIVLQNEDSVHVTGTLENQGRAAIAYTGAELFYSKQSIDYKLISSAGDYSNMQSWRIFPYTLKSRIVNNLSFQFEFSESNISQKTTAGNAYLVANPWLANAVLVKVENRVSDLFLGSPMELERSSSFKNMEIIGKEDLACLVESPWIKIQREYRRNKEEILVRDFVQLKTATIKNTEIHSQEFRALQQKIRACMDGSALIYKFQKKY